MYNSHSHNDNLHEQNVHLSIIQRVVTSVRTHWTWTPGCTMTLYITLQGRHNGRDSLSNLQPHDCFNRLFRRRSNKTSKLCVTGFCAGNSPGTGEFPAQMASNVENVSIWWRHHETPRNASVRMQHCGYWWPSALVGWNDTFKVLFGYSNNANGLKYYQDGVVSFLSDSFFFRFG